MVIDPATLRPLVSILALKATARLFVNVDVPLLLGMDILDKHRVIVDVTRNVLIHRPTNALQPLAQDTSTSSWV
jgi:hypothetical protein